MSQALNTNWRFSWMVAAAALVLVGDGVLLVMYASGAFADRPASQAVAWKPPLGLKAITNSLGMKFVPVPAGTFWMGGGGGKAGTKTEIKEDFEIGVYTVTQGQWEAVMGNNPSSFSRRGRGADKVRNIPDPELKDLPVENVSWNDSQEFIKKLNEKERGRGYLYRLPTEAEWEYACRGGATSQEECSYHYYFDKPTK